MITLFQKEKVLDITTQIIKELPPTAVKELLGGYQNDMDRLLGSMQEEIILAFNFQKTPSTENLQYLDNLITAMDISLRKYSYNYFKTTCLPSFRQGWRNLEMGSLIQLFPWLSVLASRGSGKSFETCFAFLLWRLYSYDRPNFYRGDNVDNKNRKESCIIANTWQLASNHVSKIVEEIKNNEILSAKLNPNSKATLGNGGILTETGSILHVRGKDSFIRGLHVGSVVCDDLPDESSIYSQEQREKLLDLFYGSITPIVEPYGYLWVDGCVNPKTLIQTDFGFCEIRQLAKSKSMAVKQGVYEDQVVKVKTKDGDENTSHFYYNGWSKTNLITLKCGYSLECTPKHPLRILTESGTQEWVESSKLKVGDFVTLKAGTGITGTFKLNPGIAFLLGVLQGCIFEIKGSDITFEPQNLRRCVVEELKKKGFHLIKINGILFLKLSKDDFTEVQSFLKNELYLPLESDRESILYYLHGVIESRGSSNGVNMLFPMERLEAAQKMQVILLAMGYTTSITRRFKEYNLICATELIKEMYAAGFTFTEPKAKGVLKKKSRSAQKTIPYQRQFINTLQRRYDLSAICGKGVIKGAKDGSLAGKTIRDFLEKIKKLPIRKSKEIDTLTENTNEHFIYLPIRSIKESAAFAVDLVIPNGHNFVSNGIISHNTPYQEKDIYASIRSDERFASFEYPIIFPNGMPLAPDRFTFDQIMAIKKSLGTVVFSREYMVLPVSDDSTIFPYEYLMTSTYGMENVSFVKNVESYPFKMQRIAIGCDFAISGNVGADSSVFVVVGLDVQENYHILGYWKKSGASHNEQVNQLVLMNRLFRPNVIVCESNGFQQILASLAKQAGLKNIKEFITTDGNKKNLHEGWPSLSAIFERGQFKIPYAEGETREKADVFFSEFNSISFRSDKGKLEAVSGHDDLVSATFMAVNELREKVTKYKVDYI